MSNSIYTEGEQVLNRLYSAALSALDPHAPITRVYLFPSHTHTTVNLRTDLSRICEDLATELRQASKDLAMEVPIHVFAQSTSRLVTASYKGDVLAIRVESVLEGSGLGYSLTTTIRQNILAGGLTNSER